MDAYGVRRKDTTKGPPLRILSLDGGGVRGYSMLIIVQELMHRTYVEAHGRAPRRHEIPKPCDHFDLIFGTGTGGLIAIMLGRLRLDLETCKELYVRMTRMVFQTDKTIAGIPYRSTLFKASKLEEAIRQAVREHTVNEQEGNDGESDEPIINLYSPRLSTSSGPQRHLSNASTVSFSARSPTAQAARPFISSRMGNGDARLYDSRENRTKTAVTAMYKDSPRRAAPVILRSYDSRHEPPPDFDCKIWQAGRATCAVGLAFKPIQIGQSSFHDDGVGTFNPAPEALDEAVVNEWPGRDVGVFVSVGTGKRPRSSDGSNQQVWYEGFLGDFAEARRRLIAKIEGCEKIHEFMLREHLARRNVNPENYFRMNVEIGVGEFGMNEWHRLGDISTGTRRYMARDEEQRMILGISSRLAKVHRARQRLERQANSIPEVVKQQPSSTSFDVSFAVELPGDMPSAFPPSPRSALSRASFDSGRPDSLTVGNTPPTRGGAPSPRNSYDARPGGAARYPPTASPPPPPSRSSNRSGSGTPSNNDPDRLLATAPSPSQYRHSAGADKIAIMSPDEHACPLPPTPRSAPPSTRIEPPPLPPKTPLPGHRVTSSHASNGHALPYPTDDEEEAPPPPVNMARKPEYRG
ncbi:Acyl transferase/acyl hydrolase/lysophospholipase [Cordyceps militaris CM01]|uniref:Acyl transferase/acyl hydrolase/lysophospholipase n=2 Tax=Cordyceps militaris TaxID=73501 RepID=G3JKU5_CORMM|nr:Acyl transferase/acyl hydrolase/lysophospholipase [Cordyceps militaris CM01]ATY61577.1 Acyl transferase acyl hydrolase lysophospholipase [Cordyceps militaris]EGX90319.1 Acyl transferase/acyl hydrolase/lysophospholipase [Cordyceps militaris CM01]